MDERAPLRHRAPGGLDPHAELLKPPLRSVAELVVAERCEEQALARQARELHGGDRSAAARGLPGVERVHDLAGRREPLDAHEVGPLDVPDDGDPGLGRLHARTAPGWLEPAAAAKVGDHADQHHRHRPDDD